MRIVILPFVCLVLLVSSPRSAGARPRTPRANATEDVRSKAAKVACAAGDFRKGVEILAELYVETDAPAYIYNQGRCYEQNHQWVSAIDRFREFLRKTSGSMSTERADAEKHIADCRALQEEEERKNAPSALVPQPSPPVAVLSPQPSVTSTPAEAAPRLEQERPVSAMPAIGIVAGSVGLASIVAGVVLNVKANQAADSGSESSQKSYKTGALICYGAGAAALATGVVLYLVGHERARTSGGKVAMSPVWYSGGGGLRLEGEF